MNRFIWTDLSTFDIKAAQAFYSQCFGWSYEALNDDYLVCYKNDVAVAGLYTMSEFFQSINMPSFWMSYIQVDDIEIIVNRAQAHSATIEITPQTAPDGRGLIALIRDPLGAGFTCYQGDALQTTQAKSQHVQHQLHVSDIQQIAPFYSHVFDWNIQQPTTANTYNIHTQSGEQIASIQVIEKAIKGTKEYWGVYFLVDDIDATSKHIIQQGGTVDTQISTQEEHAQLAYDPQGAAFFLTTLDKQTNNNEHTITHQAKQQTKNKQPRIKWRAIIGLLLIAMAVISNTNWLWGLLFLLWVMPDIKSGTTHFLETVTRRDNPIIYWLIITTWCTLSCYLLLAPLWQYVAVEMS